jgi:hypothetical protein
LILDKYFGESRFLGKMVYCQDAKIFIRNNFFLPNFNMRITKINPTNKRGVYLPFFGQKMMFIYISRDASKNNIKFLTKIEKTEI